ncbi:unnamed protein product [Brassica oleracea]
MNITTSTTPRIFISVPACRFEPQPSPTVCLDSGCTYQDVFSEASVYMLSCFDVTSAVLIAQVPPRHKRNALLLRVLLQIQGRAINKCFGTTKIYTIGMSYSLSNQTDAFRYVVFLCSSCQFESRPLLKHGGGASSEVL